MLPVDTRTDVELDELLASCPTSFAQQTRHWRNVITEIPGEKYTEVFLDEGEVDMLAVMKELVRQGYPRLVYPEHPPVLDHDREHPLDGIGAGYTGFAYTVGYARAMLQAALAEK